MRWDLGDVNYLVAVVAVIANFVIGFAWYAGPLSKMWMEAAGVTKEQAQKAQVMPLAFSAVRTFVAAVALNLIFDNLSRDAGLAEGLGLGLLIGLGIAAPNLVMHYVFALRNKLAVIDGAHTVVEMAVMGIIIGSWQ